MWTLGIKGLRSTNEQMGIYRGQRKELRGRENNTMVKFAIRSF